MSEAADGEVARAFPVVGVGASAGGLAATSELLRHLGPSPRVALVVVHHLDPTHESSLVDILSKVTPLSVATVTEGCPVRPDHVYVVPPNAGVTLGGGVLHLTPRVARGGAHLAIDQFLASLAEDRGFASVGVVLSGTGFDGTRGVEAIKAAGGVTFAQDASAQFGSMPASAIATGAVDFVLPPQGIARELVRLGAQPPLIQASPSPEEEAFLAPIIAAMRRGSGIDFANYKRSTLRRRIVRRTFLRSIPSLREYAELLQTSPEEVAALCEDVLIHVTSFFRDPEVFEALAGSVFPRLLDGRPRDTPIRAWVPGCSTGEEVYSLAIALLEHLDEARLEVPIKIFGTDVSGAVIDRARTASYPESIERDVSPERLKRFFTRNAVGYQVNRAVRDLCVFATHDTTRDPPFSNLDLISCRNLMIYLGPVLQERVVPLFHYALREPGFLVLGTSESVRSFVGFAAFDANNKIYARTSAAPRMAFDFVDRRFADVAAPPTFGPAPTSSLDLQREADRAVIGAIAPPGVVVTDDLAVVQFRGQTGPFLEPTPGIASLDLLRLARPELRPPLRQTIDEARAAGRAIESRLALAGGGAVSIEVIPFSPLPSQRFFVVLFRQEAAPTASAEETRGTSTDAGMTALTQELASTRRYLESVIEQAEASNEELKAANEEIVSSNEELRSMNEELQTAKEELQATNEELRTVNAEMSERNAEATRLNDDLQNVLSSVEIPIVLLGRDARVRRFTPAAAGVFRLVPTDVGRPLGDLRPSVTAPELPTMIADVLDRLVPSRRAVQDEQGRWFELLVRPYLTTDRRVDGVVVTAVDIDAVKRGVELLAESKAYAESIVDTVRESLLVLDADRRVRSANVAFFHAFAVAAEATVGKRIEDVGQGVLDAPELRAMLDRLAAGDKVEELRLDRDLGSRGTRSFSINGRRIEHTSLLLLALEDVTERKRAEEALRKSEVRFRDVLTTASEAILLSDATGSIVFANPAAERMFGFDHGELVGTSVDALVPEDPSGVRPSFRDYLATQPTGRDRLGRRKDGTTFPIEASLGAVSDEHGWIGVAFLVDVTQRRRAEQEIASYQSRLQAMAFDAAVAEEAERRRIAVDLHDRIGQTLALAQIKLAGARAGLPDEVRREIDEAVRLLEQCNVDVRSLMFDLSPPILYDLGLQEALSWLAEDLERRFGVHVDVAAGALAVPPDDATAALVFRCVRELLLNVVKHAKASHAGVSLAGDAEHVEVEVADDGVGFEPGPAAAGAKSGFGLFSVREQISRLGGAVEVASSPGGGTHVRLRVPANGRRTTEARA